MAIYDAVVLGIGGVGSAALCHLASRGAKVLGIDQFQPPHDRGSSHGQTRIIRQAYFEHPDYTPLLLESYRLWSELEKQVQRQLYHEVGVLQVGPAEGEVVPGVLQAAEQHGLQVEQLKASEIERRWSGLRVPKHLTGVLEKRAGYLRLEECVKSHLAVAEQKGAELICSAKVNGWQDSDPIRIDTDQGDVLTKKLIVTVGAWANEMLAEIGVEFEVRRKSLFWYETEADCYLAEKGFPGFLFELPAGVFYGFPQIDEQGLKLADHAGGWVVDDPVKLDRKIDTKERRLTEEFLSDYFPFVGKVCTRHEVCMYTMSPDGHFVVDRYPQCKNICFAAGLSGHGFKFASVLGKALADLALEDGTSLPIEFLSLDRLA